MATNAQKTTLHIAGTGGSAKTITEITPGFPTIVTSNAHGLANGDSGPIAGVVGTMAAAVNLSGLTIHSVTTNTFAINVNTTGLAYTSGGTFTPAPWIKVGKLSNIKGSPDTTPDNDITTLDDDMEVTSPGLRSPGSVTADIQCDDSDAGLVAMEAAHDAGSVKAFKVTYSSGATPVRAFSGYVKSFPKIGDIAKGGIITGSLEIKRTTVVTKS